MNLMIVAPKLDQENWEWIDYLMWRFYPTTDMSDNRERKRRSKSELMLVNIDQVKIALHNSLGHGPLKRDYDLYEKLYGVPHAKSPERLAHTHSE